MAEDIPSIIKERDSRIPKKERWYESKESSPERSSSPQPLIGTEAVGKLDTEDPVKPEDPIMWSNPNEVLDMQRQEVIERHPDNSRKNPQRRR